MPLHLHIIGNSPFLASFKKHLQTHYVTCAFH